MDTKRSFTAKPCTKKLSSHHVLHKVLYAILWKGPFSKKVKILIWELSHGCISTGDTLLKEAPWLISNPNWCVLCHNNGDILMHLFTTCQFAHFYWMRVISTFKDHIALPIDPITLLGMIFMGYLFKKEKEVLWISIHKTFLWLTWLD